MNCPHCHTELQKEFYHDIISFHCPDCRGRLVMISGLRTLSSSREFIDLLWKTARYGYSEQGPDCGMCGKTMKRVTLPLHGIGLELDICTSCQAIWFDAKELERLPLKDPEKANVLPPAAREKLALMEIQAEQERDAGMKTHAPEEGWQYLVGLLGLPVELDQPAVRKTPWITWSLALVCLLAFVLTCKNPGSSIREWGFIPDNWARKGGLTMLTSMFLHGGLAHLIGNLYFLLTFGDNVEDEAGKTDFLLLVLFSGLSALSLHSMLDPRSAVPCIGASGFISGIIGCYAICFPHVRLSFMWWRNIFVLKSDWNWFSIPAWTVFLLWLLWQGVMAGLTRHAGGGTAYLAHIGGVIPGLILGLRLRFSPDHERGP